MARRTLRMNEYLEMIYQWHQGRSSRQIRDSLHISRKTARKYLRRLRAAGLSRERPLPPPEELSRLVASAAAPAVFEQPAQERLRLYHQQLKEWLGQPHMTLAQMRRLLKANHRLQVSYMSLHRYVRSHLAEARPPVTVRMHTPRGEQAQVDFGYAGCMRDPQSGKQRKAWAFILVLSHSRHRFVRFVFRQDSDTWLDCHIRAFEFFQGCPRLLVLDNLKSGVLKADVYDPTLNPAYAELERHCGFVADPAKVRAARHKGKVERQVPVVRQQLIAGCRYQDIEEANQRALRWCREEIGMREHGTTRRKPYEVFRQEEAQQLLALPAEPFERARWKPCTLHPDCHLIFDKSFYSAPWRYCGQELWVRADAKLVRIYSNRQLVKCHLKACRPGLWRTDLADYPPGKRAYLEQTPEYCRRRAGELGPQAGRYVRRILQDHAMRNLRKAQGVLRLAERWGAEAVDQACRRALSFGNLRFKSLEQILEKGLYKGCAPAAPARPAPPESRFARPPQYFANPKEGS